MTDNFNKIDVIILCGGKGTRLYPVVSDRPKSLASFGDKTFLDILLNILTTRGFSRFILCTGVMGDQIKNHLKDNCDISIIFSQEDEPLGTGGALRNAFSLIKNETFIVLNGDSLCNINYPEFYHFHKNSKALLSIALTHISESTDYGNVIINESCDIVSFKEKVKTQNPCLINAGIYMMEKVIFSNFPNITHFSLETDFFPKMIGKKCKGFINNSELIDIGTPERYEKALDIIGDYK